VAWPDQRNKKKKHERELKSLYFTHIGRRLPEPIATKLGNSLYLIDVINLSKFGIDWYGSFVSGEVHNLPFPIGTITGPYRCRTAVLASDALLISIIALSIC